MARFIRYCKRDDSSISGENVFDVSRPSVLGNPFTHIRNRGTKAVCVVGSREEAVEKYGKYFDLMYERNQELRAEVERLRNASKRFDEVYIGCFCRTDESCHSDMIIRKVTEMNVRDAIIDEAKRFENGKQ